MFGNKMVSVLICWLGSPGVSGGGVITFHSSELNRAGLSVLQTKTVVGTWVGQTIHFEFVCFKPGIL